MLRLWLIGLIVTIVGMVIMAIPSLSKLFPKEDINLQDPLVMNFQLEARARETGKFNLDRFKLISGRHCFAHLCWLPKN